MSRWSFLFGASRSGRLSKLRRPGPLDLGRACGVAGGLERLAQDQETQVIPLRQAEARIAIREGPRLARRQMAAPGVPREELGALLDDRHLRAQRSPLARDALGLCEQRRAEAAPLQRRAHREQPD